MRNEKPGLGILILSVHPEEQYALRMFRAGASGYLQKESSPDELVTAVRKIAEGSKYVSDSLAERLVSTQGYYSGKLPHDLLTNREFVIMRLIADGKGPKEIANELSLSPKTVSTYRKRILGKMNMRNNIELADYARENKLLS